MRTMLNEEETKVVIDKLHKYLKTSLPASRNRAWFARKSGVSPQQLIWLMQRPPRRISAHIAESMLGVMGYDDVRSICYIADTPDGFVIRDIDFCFKSLWAVLTEAHARGFSHACADPPGNELFYLIDIVSFLRKEERKKHSAYQLARRTLEN
mgnify:FL=1